jgi:hypothetical protein
MNRFIRPEPSGYGGHRSDRMRLRLTGASDNQGNSLKPIGAQWTFYKGIFSQKSGVLPDANFAFSAYMTIFKT